MVLWEITVATAYFLGLKRTYRLALKIQRCLVGPKHPKIYQFLQRRTRVAFDIALGVHKRIQQRDLEVGRSFGNWILRWLDHAKPSAQIRPSPPVRPPSIKNMSKPKSNSSRVSGAHSQNNKIMDHDNGRRLFSAPFNVHHKSFPTIAMMLQPPRSAGIGIQYRRLCNHTPSTPEMTYRIGFQGVFRKDILQLMQS